MKKITLNGPALRNNGDFADAGTELDVGGGKLEIDAKRAKELVDRGGATAGEAPKADKVEG